METSYSLEFLQDDWEGAGFDLGLACVFDKGINHVTLMTHFITNTTHAVECILLKHCHPSIEKSVEWQYVQEDEMELFLNKGLNLEEMTWVFLEITSAHGFSGYIELLLPDQVVIGGPSENYYTGSNEKDMAIAQDMVDIAALAANVFGDGYCSFGGGTTSIQEAIKLQKGTQLPNLTSSTDTNALAEMIVETCTELRLL